MIKFKNSSKRLSDEYSQLRYNNNSLWELIQNDLVPWVEHTFNKDITVTMIFRTEEEQNSIYGGVIRSDGRSYDDRPWKSPHQFYHAIDLRSHDFTSDEIIAIENFLNNRHNDLNYYRWTAKNHSVGLGNHFHIQYVNR